MSAFFEGTHIVFITEYSGLDMITKLLRRVTQRKHKGPQRFFVVTKNS